MNICYFSICYCYIRDLEYNRHKIFGLCIYLVRWVGILIIFSPHVPHPKISRFQASPGFVPSLFGCFENYEGEESSSCRYALAGDCNRSFFESRTLRCRCRRRRCCWFCTENVNDILQSISSWEWSISSRKNVYRSNGLCANTSSTSGKIWNDMGFFSRRCCCFSLEPEAFLLSLLPSSVLLLLLPLLQLPSPGCCRSSKSLCLVCFREDIHVERIKAQCFTLLD